MCEYITSEEWVRFNSPNPPAVLRIKILRHAAGCAECKKFLEAQRRLKHALEMTAESPILIKESTAYRKVASGTPWTQKKETGFLCVHIIKRSGSIMFAEEAPEAKGSAAK